jgi:uncharacterized protein (DUF1330 family)
LTAGGAFRKPAPTSTREDKTVPARLTLVVLLFIRPNAKDEFERFESAAARAMRRYGGRLERRILFPSRGDSSTPDEMHVVTFPDRKSFEAYRTDPDLRALSAVREEAIRRTVVWEGVDTTRFAE